MLLTCVEQILPLPQRLPSFDVSKSRLYHTQCTAPHPCCPPNYPMMVQQNDQHLHKRSARYERGITVHADSHAQHSVIIDS